MSIAVSLSQITPKHYESEPMHSEKGGLSERLNQDSDYGDHLGLFRQGAEKEGRETLGQTVSIFEPAD